MKDQECNRLLRNNKEKLESSAKISSKCWEENDLQPKILYTTRLSVKCESGIKPCADM